MASERESKIQSPFEKQEDFLIENKLSVKSIKKDPKLLSRRSNQRPQSRNLDESKNHDMHSQQTSYVKRSSQEFQISSAGNSIRSLNQNEKQIKVKTARYDTPDKKSEDIQMLFNPIKNWWTLDLRKT